MTARGLVKWRGNWYFASWIDGRSTVELEKSRRMPGEGFEPGARWPGRPEGIMIRVVPMSEVQESVVRLLFRGVQVALGKLDPDGDTLRFRLSSERIWKDKNGRWITLPFEQDGWIVDDSDRASVLRSPYLDVDDPRIEKVFGTPFAEPSK